MSFPTTDELAELPLLPAWLKGRMWLEGGAFSETNHDDMMVESIRFGKPEEDDEVVFLARVRGEMGRIFEIRITLYEQYKDKTRRTTLDQLSECTCPQVFDCRHALAAYEKLRSIVTNSGLQNQLSPQMRYQISAWLRELEGAATVAAAPPPAEKPAKPNNKFLAYCIEEDYYDPRGGNGFRIVLRAGNHGKTGVSFDKGVVHLDLSNPRKYMADEDGPICLKLEQLRRKYNQWDRSIPLRGDGWDGLLDTILATGRMFVAEPDSEGGRKPTRYVHLVPGPERIVNPTWRKLENGVSVPLLEFPETDSICELLETIPMHYVDRSQGLLGRVQSHLPCQVLHAWENGPPVPTDALLDVGKGLAKLSHAVPLPLPDTKPPKIIRSIRPAPVLLIAELRVGIYQKSHIGGVVQFRYGENEFYPLADGAPSESGWYEGDERFQLVRDADLEARFIAELAAHGFTPLMSLLPASDLNEKSRHSVVLGETSMQLRPWLEFLAGPAHDELLRHGWSIGSDTKLNLAVHDMLEFFPEIEEESGHGIDWFRFDVTGEFNDRQISLIPHIAHAIREDWPARYADPDACPEHLLVPCDNPRDGHIRFPTLRFLDMVNQVRHLFHGAAKPDGPLRMDRIHAAGVADAFGVDTSETTRALAALGRNLRDIQGVPATGLPATIQAELRPYQLDGFRWLQFLVRNSLHGILADDMGLGKTLQTLAHLAAEIPHANGRPSLVIAPTSVVPNWAAETEKFAPSLKVLLLHGSERGDHFEDIAKHDIVFTTYPLLARDFEILRKQDWHALVLDEAQYIKNPKALSSQCACKLRAAHRICLSGTPMENHLGELWSLMRFLMPGFLADEKTYNTDIRKPIERERSHYAQLALNRRVSPLILRRTKDQVATDLPEKTTLIHRIDFDGKQTDLYESVRAAMDTRVRESLADKGLAKSHIIVLDALLKLRQICCHPQLLQSEAAQRVTESAKLDYLTQELLPTLLEEGRRILLFSQFTSMLKLIEEHLTLEGIPYLKLTGQTKERAKLVKQFQAGEVPVFLISLKAGGTGLNLTAADTVIHYDPWWNPAAENQATDRAHRIGQLKPIFVHKLVCRGTIEERILELQQHKAALVEALLSEETTKLKIDADTLSHLFSPIN